MGRVTGSVWAVVAARDTAIDVLDGVFAFYWKMLKSGEIQHSKRCYFYTKFFFFLFTLLNLIILELVSSVYKVVDKRIS